MSDEKIREYLLNYYKKKSKGKGPIYSDWSSWSKCIGKNGAICGPGVKKRTRTCLHGQCDSNSFVQTLDCDLGKCSTSMTIEDIKIIKKLIDDFYNISQKFLNNNINSKIFNEEYQKYTNNAKLMMTKYDPKFIEQYLKNNNIVTKEIEDIIQKAMFKLMFG